MTLLLHLQRLFIPALLALLVWAIWRLVFRRDIAIGLALYLGLVIFVDGFYNTGIYLPGPGSGSIRYSEVCALALLAARSSRRTQQPAPLRHNPLRAHHSGHLAGPPGKTTTLLVVLYFLFLFLSTLHADSPLSAIFEFRRLIVPQIVAVIVARRGFERDEDYRRFVLGMAAVSIVIALFVFWDVFFDRWLLKSEMLFKPEYWANRKHGRYGGVFLNPNMLGAFVVLVFPAIYVAFLLEKAYSSPIRKTPTSIGAPLPGGFLGVLVYLLASPAILIASLVGKGWARRLFVLGVLLGLLFALVETQSRGPFLAFGATLAIIALAPCRSLTRLRRISALFMPALLFSMLLPGFYQHASERFASLDQETSMEQRSRESVWEYTKKIIGDHPLGIGFGEQQYLRVMDDYGFRQEFGEQSLDNPHNSYLQIAVYAGWPALAAFILANVSLLAVVVRRLASNDANPIAFGIVTGVAGFLLCIYPDMHLFTQNVAPVYWVFFALLWSVVPAAPERRKA